MVDTNLVNLHNLVMTDPIPLYDKRCALSEQEYYDYNKNVGHQYYTYLLRLVARLKPKKILELGTSIGRSANFMMMALPENSTLITIDIGSYQRVDLREFAYDQRLQIVFGNDLDQDVVKQVGANFDMLFIDSEHSGEQVVAEWNIYQHKLADGAIVLMDDIHLNSGMEQFWNALPYEKIDTGTDLHFSGFGLFLYTSVR